MSETGWPTLGGIYVLVFEVGNVLITSLGTLGITNSLEFNEALDRVDSQGIWYVKETEQRYTEGKVL